MANLDTVSTNIDKNNESLEKLKELLNPKLKEYLAERFGNKNQGELQSKREYPGVENEKKKSFLAVFNTLPIKEKGIYRDYVYNVVKESPEFIKDTKYNDDFLQVLELVSAMDKLECYACICNNCKIEPQKEEELTFKEPTFSISSGKITNTKNGKTIDFGDLKDEYTGKGTYKLYLGDVGLDHEDYLLIGNNEKGGIIVYNKDGVKEFETNKKQGKIKFESKTIGIKVEFNVKPIKD